MGVEDMRVELRQVFAATNLRTHPEIDFSLVSLPPAGYAELLGALAAVHDGRFQSVVREPAELTLIAPNDLWLRVAGRFPHATVSTGWKLITLDITIPLDVYGYLEEVARLCASVGSSVIVAGGYSTDHLLVQMQHYPAVLAALQGFVDACRAASRTG